VTKRIGWFGLYVVFLLFSVVVAGKYLLKPIHIKIDKLSARYSDANSKLVKDVRKQSRELRKQLRELATVCKNINSQSVDVSSKIFSICSFEAHKRAQEIIRLLHPCSAAGCAKIRLGRQGDGGYVFLDDLRKVKSAFSFGIGGEDSWDLDVAKRGIPVLQFDHTVDRAPSTHENLKFFKCRISPTSGPDAKTLTELVDESPASESRSNLALKMDIEGDEWPVLDATDEKHLGRFAQICCEFHNLNDLQDTQHYERVKRVFEKLNKLFFVCHLHANNFGKVVLMGGVPLPETLEVTFANKELYRPAAGCEMLPCPCDTPNDLSKPDYWLHQFMIDPKKLEQANEKPVGFKKVEPSPRKK